MRLRAAVGDADAFSTLDIAFHDAVCDAAGNFLLAQFMAMINTLGKVSRERTGASRSVRERALGDHVAIVEALRAHDADAAAEAMERHLDHVEASLVAATAANPRRQPAAGEAARMNVHGTQHLAGPAGRGLRSDLRSRLRCSP